MPAKTVEPVREEKPPERPEEPADAAVPKRIVHVPKSMRRPHPIVVELRDSKKLHALTKRIRPRALRIVQALAIAAEKDGWTVQSTAHSRNRWSQEWGSKDLFVISTGECTVGITLVQENDRTPHVHTAYEMKEKERYSWTRIPEYDYRPSERLRLELGWSAHGRRYRWADRTRWRLEDKAGQVIDEVAKRHEEAREERIEREAKEAERRRLVEEAIAHAKVQLVE
ncbi:MAG: hypothetical protein RBU37_12125 [Myxococcota bacterium]|jgi:hypothetical protein|nr:hypothetical protein [Myxococcota bacterium]